MVESPRTCDCRMKPILRQEQLTHPRDLKSLSNSAWEEGPLPATARVTSRKYSKTLTAVSYRSVSSVLSVNSVLGNFLLRPKERSQLFSVINGNQTNWCRMRGIRNPLSISRIPGDSETLLGAYGYVIGGNWNRQQMAAGQNSWRHRPHRNQSQPPDIPWTGRKLWGRRFFCRGPVLRRRPDYFLRRLPGHFGWASGAAAEPRHRLRRVLRFDARPLRGHGSVHGPLGLLFRDRPDSLCRAGRRRHGRLRDGELCARPRRVPHSL